MCGILAFFLTGPFTQHNQNTESQADVNISTLNQQEQEECSISDFLELLVKRGPDSNAKIHIQNKNGRDIQMMSSLLQLQGEEKVKFPLIDANGNVLLYNGELYGGLNMQLQENDGQILLNMLMRASNNQNIMTLLKCLEGPWSLVYWKEETKELWFGRDKLGRRSLLMMQNKDHFVISSVSASLEASSAHWLEVQPSIYKIGFMDDQQELSIKKIHEWKTDPLYTRTLSFNGLQCATQTFLNKLRLAIRKRIQIYENGVSSVNDGCSPFLVLFSGGVDSVLIAALLHEVAPLHLTLDLSNVSFDTDLAPDRKNAIDALMILREWAPERHWRLIKTDSSLNAIEEHKMHLLHLLHPCDTIMDLNIGAAIWLAARASGVLHLPENAEYTSHARIAFVGHGADEQCVGYSRHRTKYREGGIKAVEQELVLEMSRLWKRNLGRDDRLISDHGREARFPFLDESVVEFLAQLPLSYLFDPQKPRGVGEKIILRESLRMVGLGALSEKPKRAIQFGTHIGKLSNKQKFGSNRAANKSHAGSVVLNDSKHNDSVDQNINFNDT